MDLRSWTAPHILLAVALYWIILAVASILYARRPGLAARQAAARAEARTTVTSRGQLGEHQVTYAATVHFTRPLLAAIVPPALLALVWLLV